MLLPPRDAGAVKEKQDASGGTFYLHRLTPWPENPNEWPEPTYTLEGGGGKCADPDTLNRVYGELLKHLPLSPQHIAELGRRGIREDPLAAGYRTLGKGRALAVQQVIKAGLEKHLPTAPGFFVQTGKRGTRYWTIGGWSGILVPVRDEQGRIIRLLVRKDGDALEGKYQWLSSKKRGGAKSAAPRTSRCSPATIPPSASPRGPQGRYRHAVEQHANHRAVQRRRVEAGLACTAAAGRQGRPGGLRRRQPPEPPCRRAPAAPDSAAAGRRVRGRAGNVGGGGRQGHRRPARRR